MQDENYKRRRFLRALVLLGGFVPVKILLALPLEKRNQSGSLSALPALLDTLIPEDISPAASQLNVGPELIRKAKQESGFERLLILGCTWLNEQARNQHQQLFEDLDEALRIAIVETAEQAPVRSLPRVFFNAVRHFAFGIYYAHPETWVSLGYSGPPQPVGFPDHAKPPESLRT
jgi:hypothetical protein